MENRRCFGCMQIKSQSPVCEHCGYNENTQNDPHQMPCGTVLRGQYLVGRVLGQGGFGITYLGWDQYLNVPVAIKEFFPSGLVARDCGFSLTVSCVNSTMTDFFHSSRERFLREARTLARFGDVPEIVRVHNFFEENGTAYIIMEYVRGVDLRKYIQTQGGKLSVQQTFSILQPVMEALSIVHKDGLVHRDISPDNIMLLPRGRAKLLDFGAVLAVGDADVDKAMTHSTQAILKHGFAPVEQYQSRGNLGPWTDVYALCATIYYCLTGNVPPEAPMRITEDIHPDWQGIPGLTSQQVQALEKGMAVRAKERIRSVEELYAALFGQPAYEAFPTTAPVAYPGPGPQAFAPTYPVSNHTQIPVQEERKSAPEPRNKSSIVLIAAVLALAAALIFFFAGRGGREDPQLESQPKSTATVPTETEPPMETTAAPTESVPTDAEIYAEAVNAYNSGNYDDAKELFDSVAEYSDSEAYLRLIRIRNAGGNDSVGKHYDASKGLAASEMVDIMDAAENFDFADTAQVLLCNSDVAFYFLLDMWDTNPDAAVFGYIDFKTDTIGGYRYNRKGTVSNAVSNDIAIEDGILYIDVHTNKTAILRMELLSTDCMELYSYETGNFFTMYRRDYSYTK